LPQRKNVFAKGELRSTLLGSWNFLSKISYIPPNPVAVLRQAQDEGGNRNPELKNCQRTPIVQPAVDYGAGLKKNTCGEPIGSETLRVEW